MILRIRRSTDSWCPSPMRLLTSELQVEAKAETNTQMKPDMLLMTLDMASDRSPRCSTNMKNMNHVDTEMKFCIMVHTEMERMSRSFFHWNLILAFSPYLVQSVLRAVCSFGANCPNASI